MSKRCFIIMPPVEPTGYPAGHFNRVYDYIIIPACRMAGLNPSRVDLASYDGPLDVVKELIDSEVAVCDVSGGNSNALYGLVVRQSLDLPTVALKDVKSSAPFNPLDPGLVEYDDSLRIDTVQNAVTALTEALNKSLETKKDRHTLLNRFGVGITVATPESAPVAAPEPEEQKPKEKLNIISPLPDYVGDSFTEQQIEKLKAGDVLFHLVHGKGKIKFVEKKGRDTVANIQFDSGPKILVVGATDFFRKING